MTITKKPRKKVLGDPAIDLKCVRLTKSTLKQMKAYTAYIDTSAKNLSFSNLNQIEYVLQIMKSILNVTIAGLVLHKGYRFKQKNAPRKRK